MTSVYNLILVDTNVIIDFWKNPSEQATSIFKNETIAICGIVQAELMHGAKNDKELTLIIKALDELLFLDMSRFDWIETGKYLYRLKKEGLTVPFQDIVIAYCAVKYNAHLWTYDRHFERIRTVIKELNIIKP